jgi:hypothetical protein
MPSAGAVLAAPAAEPQDQQADDAAQCRPLKEKAHAPASAAAENGENLDEVV